MRLRADDDEHDVSPMSPMAEGDAGAFSGVDTSESNAPLSVFELDGLMDSGVRG